MLHDAADFIAAQAQPFASTTGGYITAVLVPIIGALFIAKWQMDRKNQASQTAAITQLTLGVASLVQTSTSHAEDINEVRDAQAITNGNVNALDRAVGILQSVIARHEQWHERNDGRAS